MPHPIWDKNSVPDLIRISFLCGEYKEIGLVCQTEFSILA